MIQEIPLEKGNHVLKIIHNYKHETSLFDDFEYYDDKQDQETNKLVQKVNQGGNYYDQKQYYDDKQDQETNKIGKKVNQGGDYYDQKQYSKIKDGQFGRGKAVHYLAKDHQRSFIKVWVF